MAAGQVPQADTGPRDLALAPEPCRRYAPRMTDSMRITILLASFQGERFIGAQLDSLARQDHRNWRLILSDDGSTDGTLEIVRRFAAAHPSREIEIRQVFDAADFGDLVEKAPEVFEAERKFREGEDARRAERQRTAAE